MLLLRLEVRVSINRNSPETYVLSDEKKKWVATRITDEQHRALKALQAVMELQHSRKMTLDHLLWHALEGSPLMKEAKDMAASFAGSSWAATLPGADSR
jgi:hypothetical protein